MTLAATYAEGQAAILTLLRTSSYFDASNSAAEDYDLIDAGGAPVYAVVTRRDSEGYRPAAGVKLSAYVTAVEVIMDYTAPGTDEAYLETVIADVRGIFDGARTLQGAALTADVRELPAIEERGVLNADGEVVRLLLVGEIAIQWQA